MPLVPPPYDAFFYSCDEIPYQRTGTVYSWDGPRDYVRRHKVIVKYKEMQPVDVCLCPFLPKGGENYLTPGPGGGVGSYDLLAICTNQKAEQQDGDDWGVWIVTSTYSTNISTRNLPGSAGALGASNNPENELAQIEWDFETAQEVQQRDLRGQAFTNSAHHLLTPSPVIERDYPVLHISRNELGFNFFKANLYARCLNDAPFLGAPRGCVMCMPPKSVQKQKGLLYYQRTSYKLKFRCLQDDGTYYLPKINVLLLTALSPVDDLYYYQRHEGKTDMLDSWQPLVLDQGMYRLGSAGRTPPDPSVLIGKNNIKIRDRHTLQPVSHNVCLNGAGQESQNPEGTGIDVPIPVWYKQFKTHRYLSLTDLLVNGLG